MKIFTRIIALLFLAIAVFMFVMASRSYMPSNNIAVGIASLVMTGLLFRVSGKKWKNTENGDTFTRIYDLKKNGKRLTVPLAQCVIRDYPSDESLYYSNPIAPQLDFHARRLWNLPADSTDYVVLEYTALYHGQSNIYTSYALPFEAEDLKAKLDARQTATLYIHPYDPTLYFLDLDFLAEPTA